MVLIVTDATFDRVALGAARVYDAWVEMEKAMVRGLTDKESLEVVMKGPREDRRVSARVQELAEKGLQPPHHLTPEETLELCSSVMRKFERDQSR